MPHCERDPLPENDDAVEDREIVMLLGERKDAERAVTLLLRKYGGRVQAMLRRRYRKHRASVDEDDILFRAALKAWCAIKTLEQPERLGPWFLRIADREALTALRQYARRASHERPSSELDNVAATRPPEECEASSVSHGSRHPVHVLDTYIAQLPPRPRAAIAAQLDADFRLTMEDLASVLGVTRNAASIALTRGYKLLRQSLETVVRCPDWSGREDGAVHGS